VGKDCEDRPGVGNLWLLVPARTLDPTLEHWIDDGIKHIPCEESFPVNDLG